MMTLKLMTSFRTRILEAESFTVLHQDANGIGSSHRQWAEITGHRADGHDFRYDVGPSDHPEKDRIFDRAYIENAHGKTVERIDYGPSVT